MTEEQPTAPRPERFAIYTIVEREGAKDYWLRIGDAYRNKDNSIKGFMYASPINGQFHIRAVTPKQKAAPTAEPTTEPTI